MSQTTVFLSYARADDDPNYDDPAKSFLRRLYDRLTEAGFNVWWDRKSLPSRGLAFTAEIEAAIRASQRFVLVVGPGAAASDYVKAEWRCALRECLPVTPIVWAGDYDLIPAEIGALNAIDFRPPRDEAAALDDLIARLRQDAPLGYPVNVKPLPPGYLLREAPMNAARAALCADAIQPTVVSAPAQATALYGMGGVGKSTLAAALARDCQIRRHFVDGILWLEVGPTPNVLGLQSAIGVHYGDARDNYRDEAASAFHLSRVLRDKRALIVLDDVWDHKLVERFPIDGTACRLLITTRSGALARHVNGADIRLELLTPEEGAALIAARAGGSPDDPTYKAISVELGGHTLAVALAAAQLASGYADDAADLLRLLRKRAAGPEPLADLKIDPNDKDKNLALSLSLSYEALSDDLKRRFRALGVVSPEGTFDRALLAALWGDADPDDTRAPLQALLGASLLDDAGDRRYSLHRLLRAYARALLMEQGELETAFACYADYVIEQAAQFDELPLEQWAQLDPLLPHVAEVGDELAKRWAAASEPDEALQARCADFADNIVRYCIYHPDILLVFTGTALAADRLRWLENGITASEKLKRFRQQSRLLYYTASVFDQMGDYARALALYEASLKTKKQLNDPREIAVTQSKIADLYVQQGRWDEALALYEASLKTFQQLNDPRAIAVTQVNLAQHLIARNENLVRAVELLWSGYQIIERLKNPREIQTVRLILTRLKQRMGAEDFGALWVSVTGTSPTGLAGDCPG